MNRRTARQAGERSLTYGGALLVLAVVAGPMLWMISTSLKPPAEVFTSPPRLVPRHPVLSNYTAVLDGQFLRFLANSVIVALGTTILCLLVGILAAFALSRPGTGGRRVMLMGLLLTQLLPQAVLLVPIYRTAAALHLTNTYQGLMIAYLAFDLPVAIWLLRGFFSAVPRELVEAARVDGASELGAFVRVVLPVVMPGIVATGAYVYFATWQDFLYALVFMTSNNLWTLPLGVLSFIGAHTIDWGKLMAASVVLLAPIVILFGLVQRQFVAGLTQGAVKG